MALWKFCCKENLKQAANVRLSYTHTLSGIKLD